MIQHLTEIVDEARKRGKKRLGGGHRPETASLGAGPEIFCFIFCFIFFANKPKAGSAKPKR